MSYAVGPEAQTDYSLKYYWSAKKNGESETVPELRKGFCSQKSHDPAFFVWFFTSGSHLAEIETSRREVIYKTFIKSVSLLTECKDPYTAKHQKKVSGICGRHRSGNGIARRQDQRN